MQDAQGSLQRMMQDLAIIVQVINADHHRREDWYGTRMDSWITPQHSSY